MYVRALVHVCLSVCVRGCMLVCMHLSRFAITSTFIHEFQIIWQSCCPLGGEVPFETFFSCGRRSGSHLKVTYIELAWAIPPTFMDGFHNNLACVP